VRRACRRPAESSQIAALPAGNKVWLFAAKLNTLCPLYLAQSRGQRLNWPFAIAARVLNLYRIKGKAMSDLLKGNFAVKRAVNVNEEQDAAAEFNKEYRKKALESIGGSMVFVERQKLFWDGDVEQDEKKP
jgi:hypothetical protein